MNPGQITSSRAHPRAPSRVTVSIVAGPSHAAGPKTDWKATVRAPRASPRRASRAATVPMHSERYGSPARSIASGIEWKDTTTASPAAKSGRPQRPQCDSSADASASM